MQKKKIPISCHIITKVPSSNCEKYNFVLKNSDVWSSCSSLPNVVFSIVFSLHGNCRIIILFPKITVFQISVVHLNLKLPYLANMTLCQFKLMYITWYHGLILINADINIYYWVGSMDNSYKSVSLLYYMLIINTALLYQNCHYVFTSKKTSSEESNKMPKNKKMYIISVTE